MKLEWKHSLEGICWETLAELYRQTPLGDKRPEDLQTAFTNSLFPVSLLRL